jgi:hypothetical protein
MNGLANGTFAVTMAPQAQEAGVGDASIGRMALGKIFSGDLDATSKGQMLAVRTSIDGSAGYVAMEQVVGTLHGRDGNFALQHSGTMTRGKPTLRVTVVPDSGGGQLIGIAGTLEIAIVEGTHRYVFDYTLPDTG